MNDKLFKEIAAITEKFASNEEKVFQSTKEFYDYLKTQGVTASLDDVRNVLIDLSKQKPKQELDLEFFDDIAGGAQVEVKNTVKNNKKNVNIGKTIVINVWVIMKKYIDKVKKFSRRKFYTAFF